MSSAHHSFLDASANLQPAADRLIKLDQVMSIVGLGKTLIYRLVGDGAFPKPLKLGSNASRWSEGEIFSWIANQIAARPAVAG
jgi:prophage regulatory protein